jgi:hypothetical protein
MKKLKLVLILPVIFPGLMWSQQDFFLDSWKPKNVQVPEHQESSKIAGPANVVVTIHAGDTITRIPVYMFGDNANAYTGSMSENRKLMKHLADRNMGVLRGPSGSISDVYFWNRSEYGPPVDVPETLLSGGVRQKLVLVR